MLLDTFSFFNEKELLELRIKLLYSYVDKFIICEGDHTHRGEYKGFVLEDVLATLDIPTDKIQVVKVYMPSYEQQPNAWVRERMQRDAAMAYIKEDDICIVADLDEIPDPSKLEAHVYALEQVLTPKEALETILCFHMHNLQQRADQELLENGDTKHWIAAYVCKGKAFCDYTMSRFREGLTERKPVTGYYYRHVYEQGISHIAGWHFSWMGNNTVREKKLKSFAHWDEFENIHNTTDILGRPGHTLRKFDTSLLPRLIYQVPKLKQFLLP